MQSYKINMEIKCFKKRKHVEKYFVMWLLSFPRTDIYMPFTTKLLCVNQSAFCVLDRQISLSVTGRTPPKKSRKGTTPKQEFFLPLCNISPESMQPLLSFLQSLSSILSRGSTSWSCYFFSCVIAIEAHLIPN